MGEAENIEVIEQFCAEWSGPSVDIPKVVDYFTEDAVYHNMPIQPVQGKDAIKGVIEQFMAPYERADWQIKSIAASGDSVLTERVDRFLGAEKPIELLVMGVFELSGGKISAWRDYFDLASWTRQVS